MHPIRLRHRLGSAFILLIIVVVFIFVLLIIDDVNINGHVDGRRESDSSSIVLASSIGELQAIDQVIPAVQFNGHIAPKMNVGLIHLDDNDPDDDDEGSVVGDGQETEDADEYDDVEYFKKRRQVNKLEQLKLDPTLDEIRKKMIARQDHLHKECARLGMRRLNLEDPKDLGDVIAHTGNLDIILWNDQYRFITSVIFKCGSSNWRKFLESLVTRKDTIKRSTSNKHIILYKPNQPLSSLVKTPLQIKYRLKNYLKIVTVRHPLIRFLSGYRDKFLEHTDKFRNDIARRIIDSRNVNNRVSIVGPKHVTFPEFADYVTRMQPASMDLDKNDAHWIPQHIRSRPCQHDYDIIAKLETSDDDLYLIKHLVGIDEERLFQNDYKERHEVSHNDTLVQSYYRQLSEEAFQRVCDYYRVDFELFGYYRPQSVSDIASIFDDFF